MSVISFELHPGFRKCMTVSLLGLGLLLSGCITRKTVIPQNQRLLPAQTRSFKELLQDLERCSRAIKTVKAARVLFQPSGGARKKGELTETRVPVAGFLLMNRPNDIRIRLNVPLFGSTGADLVSNGQSFKVWIPFTNKLYDGKADESIRIGGAELELPPPADISSAMFVDIVPYLNNPKYRLFPKEKTIGTHSYYVVDVVSVEGVGTQIVQEIWVDRTNMEITQQVMYGKEGKVLTDTEFAGYRITDSSSLPHALTIHRPEEDVDLKITFQNPPEVNTVLSIDTFQLDTNGAEIVHMSR
jgi:outer membrane lipoprotein-sorting protein